MSHKEELSLVSSARQSRCQPIPNMGMSLHSKNKFRDSGHNSDDDCTLDSSPEEQDKINKSYKLIRVFYRLRPYFKI